MNKGPVLVIGATGQQGGATVQHLLERGRTVHALVRDPDSAAAKALRVAGADLVVGDLDDPDSLRTAMAGAHGVFLVLTMMTGPRISAEGVARRSGAARSWPTSPGRPASSRRTPIEQLAQMFAFFNEHPAEPSDLSALRAEHPDLMTLATWLRTTGWRP